MATRAISTNLKIVLFKIDFPDPSASGPGNKYRKGKQGAGSKKHCMRAAESRAAAHRFLSPQGNTKPGGYLPDQFDMESIYLLVGKATVFSAVSEPVPNALFACPDLIAPEYIKYLDTFQQWLIQ
jgi:hypothetical protein